MIGKNWRNVLTIILATCVLLLSVAYAAEYGKARRLERRCQAIQKIAVQNTECIIYIGEILKARGLLPTLRRAPDERIKTER